MDYTELQKGADEFKDSCDIGINIKNMDNYENNKLVNKILNKIFIKKLKEESNDNLIRGYSIYKRFKRYILSQYLEKIGWGISEQKIDAWEFGNLMKLPMFLLEVSKECNNYEQYCRIL